MIPITPKPTVQKIKRSNDEWRQILTEEQFRVGVKDGTERAFSPGNHNDEKRDGTYHCVGCDTPLWSSQHKFDSGTGWPSFWDVLPGATLSREDNTLFMKRTEIICSRCGSHIGHVFKDGPAPTGLRYCMNGLAMVFSPA